jgi:hypothetical protein
LLAPSWPLARLWVSISVCALRWGIETVSWVCILGAAPVAAAGFFHFNGLNLEQYLWAVFKSEWLCAKEIVKPAFGRFLLCIKKSLYCYTKHLLRQYCRNSNMVQYLIFTKHIVFYGLCLWHKLKIALMQFLIGISIIIDSNT